MLIWATVATILSVWAENPAIPIHGIYPCNDWRFPAATEEWVLGCSKKGEIDRVWFFETKKSVSLPVSGHWLKGSDLFRVGMNGGFWDAQKEVFLPPRIFASPEETAGVVNQGFVVLSTPDSIMILEREEGKTYTTEAKPMGYQFPVILGEYVAWIEWAAEKQEIVIWDWKKGNKEVLFVEDPLYLEAEGDILVWSEPQKIQVFNIKTSEKKTIQARAKGALSIKDQRICWAEWQEAETNIVCSDGFELDRKGNQFSPFQLETGLLFQEEQGVMWMPY